MEKGKNMNVFVPKFSVCNVFFRLNRSLLDVDNTNCNASN